MECVEIERKFLVDIEEWVKFPKPQPVHVKQGYLTNTPDITIRLRVKGKKGFITVKGATKGISREEFEYEIPADDVEEMVRVFKTQLLSKWRYTIAFAGHLWEVDVFEGNLTGLILAEIELKSEDERFQMPPFVGEEVSDNPEYYNSNLILKC
jgi:CYTH domain-containing protein